MLQGPVKHARRARRWLEHETVTVSIDRLHNTKQRRTRETQRLTSPPMAEEVSYNCRHVGVETSDLSGVEDEFVCVFV